MSRKCKKTKRAERRISDLPATVQGELHRSSLKGKINGGGPSMHLRTSAGNIHIKKKLSHPLHAACPPK